VVHFVEEQATVVIIAGKTTDGGQPIRRKRHVIFKRQPARDIIGISEEEIDAADLLAAASRCM
jgi:hypothetical protein